MSSNFSIVELTQTESTNNYARMLLESSKPAELTVVKSDFQSHGRGQIRNTWESERGKNLLFSLILYPTFLSASKHFYLSKTVSLGICSCIKQWVPEVKIKWPNDVYYQNKKLGGILIEQALMGDNVEYSIAGAGVNINQEIFPSDLPNPVSLKQITGVSYSIKELLNTMLEKIEEQYELLKNKEFKKIDEQYLSMLFRHGQTNSFESNHEQFKGIITGVEETGALVVRKENNQTATFYFNEISIIL